MQIQEPTPVRRCEMADRVRSMFDGRSGATPLRLQRQARQNLTATQKKSRRDAGVTNAGVFRDGEVLILAQDAATLRGNRSGLGSGPYECKFKSPRPYDRCEMADRVPSMFGGRSGATPLRLQI